MGIEQADAERRWHLEGALAWQAQCAEQLREANRIVRQLNQSKRDDLMEQYNQLEEYIDEQYIRVPDSYAPAVKGSELRLDYLLWCEERQIIPLSDKLLKRALIHSEALTNGSTHGGITWKGIKPRANFDE